MKTAILILARLSSTRLTRKMLLPLKGRCVIDHLIDRLKQVKTTDNIILCTSKIPADDALVDIASHHGIRLFRGSETNVPARLLLAAIEYGLDFMVVVEGDEIFIDPSYVDRMIAEAQRKEIDFMALNGFPIGAYLLGIRTSALRQVCEWIGRGDDVDTDGWGRYFTQTGLFKIHMIEPEEEGLRRPEVRLTLDYPEDYQLVCTIYDRLYIPGNVINLMAVLELIDSDSKLMQINAERARQYREHTNQFPHVRIPNHLR